MLRTVLVNSRRALSSVSSGGLRITERCAARLDKLVHQRGHQVALRVTVDGGGCSGYQYGFTIEDVELADSQSSSSDRRDGEKAEQPKTNATTQGDDIVFREHGAEVRVDPISFAFIKGSTVDYVEELISSSFRVTDNPNADVGCGCGTSFSAKM